jgi:hypothetical protein
VVKKINLIKLKEISKTKFYRLECMLISSADVEMFSASFIYHLFAKIACDLLFPFP